MTKGYHRGRKPLITCLTLLATACGGGGGGSGGGPGGGDTGGIDRGGIIIASGTITGFGSIHVNGVHYATAGATILVDDQPGTESDLRVGQVVRIEGRIDTSGTTGTATRVVFDDEVEGPVESVDLANSRMIVLGQTIVVDAATSFDDSIVPRGLDGLVVGNRVEVSGLVESSGTIVATRVELKTVASNFEVKGTVANLVTTNPAALRFTVGQLTVDYTGATLSGFASGQPANGDRVEAFGNVGAGGVFMAARVEKESGGSPGSSDDQADYEGPITSFVSAADFSVAGQRVTTNSSTVFEGGTASGLALDVQVEVEGRFNAAGVIVASKVQFRRDSDFELSARVDSVNSAANSLVVLGVTVRTNALTRFEDQSDADVDRFSLANLAVGDFVEVRAYNDGSGLVATLLERDDDQGRVEVEGPASAVAQPSFTIGGVAVTTDANTQFRDNNGVSITPVAFFAAAATGQPVKVRGALVGNTVLAERAELEN